MQLDFNHSRGSMGSLRTVFELQSTSNASFVNEAWQYEDTAVPRKARRCGKLCVGSPWGRVTSAQRKAVTVSGDAQCVMQVVCPSLNCQHFGG